LRKIGLCFGLYEHKVESELQGKIMLHVVDLRFWFIWM